MFYGLKQNQDKQTEKVQFTVIDNDQLRGRLEPGDLIECSICGEKHEIKGYSSLLFYDCGGQAYLAGIGGKRIEK